MLPELSLVPLLRFPRLPSSLCSRSGSPLQQGTSTASVRSRTPRCPSPRLSAGQRGEAEHRKSRSDSAPRPGSVPRRMGQPAPRAAATTWRGRVGSAALPPAGAEVPRGAQRRETPSRQLFSSSPPPLRRGARRQTPFPGGRSF